MITGLAEALLFSESTDWDSAQGALYEAGLGDGLPLVVPTEQRLEAMLAGVPDRTQSLGSMPPLMGELTLEAIAYCAVIAGCLPRELPVVAAASAATLASDFNLLGIQTTTGSAAVCLLVHGRAVDELEMNSGGNCLGPGNRANACIGRALQLVLRNVGGARAGIGDMATMGQPGKYVFCFAESQPSSLSDMPELQSAVTVMGVSGAMEVIPHSQGDTPEAALLPLIAAMHGARSAVHASPIRQSSFCGQHYILMPPEVGQLFEAIGWDPSRVQNFILSRSPPGEGGEPWALAPSAADIRIIATGGVGIKMTYLVPWGAGSRSVTAPVLPLSA